MRYWKNRKVLVIILKVIALLNTWLQLIIQNFYAQFFRYKQQSNPTSPKIRHNKAWDVITSSVKFNCAVTTNLAKTRWLHWRSWCSGRIDRTFMDEFLVRKLSLNENIKAKTISLYLRPTASCCWFLCRLHPHFCIMARCVYGVVTMRSEKIFRRILCHMSKQGCCVDTFLSYRVLKEICNRNSIFRILRHFLGLLWWLSSFSSFSSFLLFFLFLRGIYNLDFLSKEKHSTNFDKSFSFLLLKKQKGWNSNMVTLILNFFFPAFIPPSFYASILPWFCYDFSRLLWS